MHTLYTMNNKFFRKCYVSKIPFSLHLIGWTITSPSDQNHIFNLTGFVPGFHNELLMRSLKCDNQMSMGNVFPDVTSI